MAYQRTHRPLAQKSPSPETSSPFAPRPFAPKRAPVVGRALAGQHQLDASSQGDLDEEELLLQRKFDASAADPVTMQTRTDRRTGDPHTLEGAPREPKLQTAGSGPQMLPVRVVQRIVINMDPTDKTINESARIHKDRETATNKRSDSKAPEARVISGKLNSDEKVPPLSTIDPGEEITIVAHGVPARGGDVPRVATLTAEEMFQHLVAMGLTSKHTGKINLSNCTSAWDRKGGLVHRYICRSSEEGWIQQSCHRLRELH